MLVAERQKKIVELVNIRKSIRVSELSESFNVTEETIRRDLEKLEKENKLKRSHGGAVSIQEEDTDVSEREITNVSEKKPLPMQQQSWLKAGTGLSSMQARQLGTWQKPFQIFPSQLLRTP